MDVAALSLSIDSSSVTKATGDLDKFASASTRAGATAKDSSGSTARMAEGYARAAERAARAADMADRVAQAQKLAAVSNDNMAVSAVRTGAALDKVTQAAGAQRAGMQQLGMQVGDMATMYSLGARPAQIFASQIGQVTQAVQLMAGGTSKFATFLGGPWGIALSTAAVLLSPFIAKLFETKGALDDVGKAAEDAMAKLDASLARTDAFTDVAADRTTKLVTAMGDYAKANRDVASAEASLAALRRTFGAGDAVPAVEAQLSRALAAQADAQKRMDAARSDLSQLKGRREAEAMQERNRKILEGDPSKPSGSRGAGGKIAADIAAQQAAAIERLDQEELRAKLALAQSAEDRASLSYDLLNAERAQRVREIEASKGFTAAQKAAQIAYLDRLYGVGGFDGQEITVDGSAGLLGRAIQRDLQQQQNRAANDMLRRQAATLDAWAQIEPNTRKRAEMESSALALQQKIETNLLEQEKASMAVADYEKAQAALASQQAAARARLTQQNLTPGQRYAADLRASVENVNDALERVQVRGLERLNDGLVDAITGVRSLGSVFKDVTNGIISDLMRIAIQRSITEPLANALFGGGRSLESDFDRAFGVGGGGGGLFSKLFGGTGGWSMFAHGGAFDQAQRFANGGAFTNNIYSSPTLFKFANGSKFGLMGESGPEAVMPLTRGPNGKLGVQSHGGGRPVIKMGDVHNHISLAGAIGMDGIVSVTRQGMETAVNQVWRELQSKLAQLDQDGAMVS